MLLPRLGTVSNINTLFTSVNVPLRGGKLSSEGSSGSSGSSGIQTLPGTRSRKRLVPFLVLAFDADSMLCQLDLRVGHLSNAALALEKAFELKADVARSVCVTIEMGLAILVLADSQSPNLSVVPTAPHRRMRAACTEARIARF